VIGDGGQWLRANCLILARMDNMPVPWLLHLPLRELAEWISAHNDLQQRINQR